MKLKILVGIEAVRAGERVWGFDRQAGAWALGTVTATKRTESVTLTTATLANGAFPRRAGLSVQAIQRLRADPLDREHTPTPPEAPPPFLPVSVIADPTREPRRPA